MTHYAQLAQALEYGKGSGEALVLRGSSVTLDDLVDHFLADELDGWSKEHPSVDRYHVQQVADILDDILRDVPDPARARRQLQKQASWALLSERVSMLIEREADNLSKPPNREELLTLTRRALGHLDPEPATIGPGRAHQEAEAGGPSALHDPRGAPRSGSRQSLQEIAAELTDCASRIRNTVDQLQGDHPVHAAYAREIATRLDELLVDLLPPGREE